MSTIQILNTSDKTYNNLGRYFMVEMVSGKHSAIVIVKPTSLQVIVQNAANRCWRGMGKSFPTAEAALTCYKTGEIRAMITTAVEMSSAAVAA